MIRKIILCKINTRKSWRDYLNISHDTLLKILFNNKFSLIGEGYLYQLGKVRLILSQVEKYVLLLCLTVLPQASKR